MKRLLSIELQKIWMNKASRILTLTYFILLSFIALVAALKFEIGNFTFQPSEMGIFNFPFIWHFNSYIAVFFKLFLAIVIVSMMANEYTYGTLKQNLIDGLSKKEFVISKFLTVLIFAVCSTIFVFIITLILGLSYSSYTEFGIIFSDLDYLLAYFVNLLGFFSFCLFIGILVKRSAFALGFLLIWFCFEIVLKWFLASQVFPDSDNDLLFTQFLPLESISNLLIEPLSRLSLIQNMGSKIGIESTKDYSVSYTAVFIVLAWTVIFISSSYKLLKNRDL